MARREFFILFGFFWIFLQILKVAPKPSMLFSSCFVLLLLILGKETNGGGEDKTRKRKRLSCSIFGDLLTLSKEQKKKVTEECLSDMKKRLVDVANIIQSHFERVRIMNITVL